MFHLANITRVFPWWPTLHSWWRTNPGYNTVFSIADGGQDLEGQALVLFKLGLTVSETDSDSSGSGFCSPGGGGLLSLDVPHSSWSSPAGGIYPDLGLQMDSDMFDDMYTNNEPSTLTGSFMDALSWSELLSNSEPSPLLCLPPSALHLPSSSHNSSPSSLYPPPFSHDPSPSHQAPLSHQAPSLHQAPPLLRFFSSFITFYFPTSCSTSFPFSHVRPLIFPTPFFSTTGRGYSVPLFSYHFGPYLHCLALLCQVCSSY